MEEERIFDVTVIGGGPAGLYSAFYSGLREMTTKIIDYQPQLGGKLHLYPEKMIWDVGGVTPIPGARLIERLVRQGLTFGPTVFLKEQITSIARDERGMFVLQAASGRKHISRTVIVAVGSGILKPQKLELEGAHKFEVTNLHYTVSSLQRFRDKTVIISGGGNSAVDWANELEPVAKKVYVAYRKEAFSGHEAQIKKLLTGSAVCLFHTSITKLLADAGDTAIDRVELTDHRTGEVTVLPVDEAVISHGYERDASLFENSGLKIAVTDDGRIAGNGSSESSVDGLYAAGDILMHAGKLQLIAGAFQDAANAVNKAKRYIQPGAEESAMVSSHNEALTSRNKELAKQWLNYTS